MEPRYTIFTGAEGSKFFDTAFKQYYKMEKIKWHMPDFYRDNYKGYASSALTNEIVQIVIDYVETLVHKRRI